MKLARAINDHTFQRTFSKRENFHLTIHLLNSLLDLQEGNKVTSIASVDPRVIPQDRKKKSNVIDLYVTDQQGRRFIIELQILEQKHFDKRVLHILSNTCANQLKRGNKYSKLCPVIFIGILNFNLFPEEEAFSAHLLTHQKSQICYFRDIGIYFLELLKITSEINTPRDEWGIYFTTQEGGKTVPEQIRSKEVKQAYQELNMINWTTKERKAYVKAEMEREDIQNVVALEKERGFKEGKEQGKKEGKEQGKKEGREQGKKEGREQGKKEGREQGKKEGREQGKKEGREQGKKEGEKKGLEKGKKEAQVAIAKKMLQSNTDIGTIIEFTELTKKEVMAMKSAKSAKKTTSTKTSAQKQSTTKKKK